MKPASIACLVVWALFAGYWGGFEKGKARGQELQTETTKEKLATAESIIKSAQKKLHHAHIVITGGMIQNKEEP